MCVKASPSFATAANAAAHADIPGHGAAQASHAAVGTRLAVAAVVDTLAQEDTYASVSGVIMMQQSACCADKFDMRWYDMYV